MTDLTLFHCPRTRSFHALWMLEEIGEPYDIKIVNIRDETENEAYEAINPMRKVPALEVDGSLITESPAICAWLADAYPQAGLAPAIKDKDRGEYLRWMFFCAACIEPSFIDKQFDRNTPHNMAGWGNVDSVLRTLERGLEGQDYLVGNTFSAADVMVGSTLNFLISFNMLEKKEPFASYVDRLTARDAFKRATQKDQDMAIELYGE